jgi:membrane associated rhomboid family serine protease
LFPLRDNIPTEHFPIVTVLIIVANCIVYFFLQDGFLGLPDGGAGGNWSVVDYALIPYEVTNPGDMCEAVGNGGIVCEGQPGVTGVAEPQPSVWVTVFTSMFMHGSLLHIGGNMLFLWIFGNNVEDAMGPVRFIAFYLLGGIAAVALQTAVDPDAAVPSIGASGAVAAVLGGYLLLYPRAKVLTLVFLFVFFAFIQLPALLFLLIWFAQQALFGIADLTNPTGGGGGVAYFAHIGGFLFGLAAIKLFANRQKHDYVQPKYPVY